MPFGIPSEDFHGGFGLPEVEECVVINYDDTDGEAKPDDYDPYTGKYAFVSPDDVSDEEYEAAAQEAHDELVRSLVEAGGEIRELNDEKNRLIFALKEAVEWLDYFLTTERDDIYHDEASEARYRAEYLLMELEDAK